MLGAGLSHPVALLIQFINFAILVGIIVKFGKKPFKDYLKKRHETVKTAIEDGERALKEAEEVKAAYVEKLSKLEEEVEAFRAKAVKEAEAEKKKILDEAHGLASRIREQARLAYEQEMKEAMAKVRAEVAERTIKAAEETVRKTFKKEDHDSMVEDFIRDVRSIN
jgi:F-type H+-transporting ATPase subunit b